jgi:SNF2 family DNA or RNA helicase
MDDVEPIDMPEELSCKLLPHQVQGIQWLKSRETGKNKGGILADDVRCRLVIAFLQLWRRQMGLGKTVQTIGLILANQPEKKPRGTLIVVPLALKEQWAAEIKAKVKAGVLTVLVHHGTNRTKDVSLSPAVESALKQRAVQTSSGIRCELVQPPAGCPQTMTRWSSRRTT